MDMHTRRLQWARANQFEINRKGPCGDVVTPIGAALARKLIKQGQEVFRYTEDGQVRIDRV